jgi:hypothetical protein
MEIPSAITCGQAERTKMTGIFLELLVANVPEIDLTQQWTFGFRKE